MNDELKQTAALLVSRLIKAGKTLSAAESCTGGLISEAITSVPGASKVFELGLCVYSENKKIKVLGVPPDIIAKYGVVSSETVLSMADCVKKLAVSDYAVSVSGVAGPGGGTEENPVGTVWIGWAYHGNSGSEKNIFSGSRDEIREKAALCAIEIITDMLNGVEHDKT